MLNISEIKWSGKEDSNLRPLPPEDRHNPGKRRKPVLSLRFHYGTDGEGSANIGQIHRRITGVLSGAIPLRRRKVKAPATLAGGARAALIKGLNERAHTTFHGRAAQ